MEMAKRAVAEGGDSGEFGTGTDGGAWVPTRPFFASSSRVSTYSHAKCLQFKITNTLLLYSCRGMFDSRSLAEDAIRHTLKYRWILMASLCWMKRSLSNVRPGLPGFEYPEERASAGTDYPALALSRGIGHARSLQEKILVKLKRISSDPWTINSAARKGSTPAPWVYETDLSALGTWLFQHKL